MSSECPSAEDIYKSLLENHQAWELGISCGFVADSAGGLFNIQQSYNYFFKVAMSPV